MSFMWLAYILPILEIAAYCWPFFRDVLVVIGVWRIGGILKERL